MEDEQGKGDGGVILVDFDPGGGAEEKRGVLRIDMPDQHQVLPVFTLRWNFRKDILAVSLGQHLAEEIIPESQFEQLAGEGDQSNHHRDPRGNTPPEAVDDEAKQHRQGKEQVWIKT